MSEQRRRSTREERQEQSRQANAAAEARKLQDLRNRRLLIGGISAFAGATLLGGTGLAFYNLPRTYHGPIKDLEGKELVPAKKIAQLTDALISTDHPFLAKIGKDIQFLSTTTKKPDELPSWVTEQSFPLIITSTKSNVAFASSHTKYTQPPEDSVPLPERQDIGYAEEITSTDLGINIINPPLLVNEGPLAEAFFLAKEHMTNMYLLRMAGEFHKVVTDSGNTYVDYQLNVIQDPEVIRKAGEATFSRIIADKSSTWHHLWDIIPVMLLASPAYELQRIGKLKQQTGLLGFIRPGIDFSRTPDLYALLEGMRKDWILEQTFMPPKGVTQSLRTHPLGTYATNFHQFQ